LAFKKNARQLCSRGRFFQKVRGSKKP